MTTRRGEMKTRKQREKKETGHANKIHARDQMGGRWVGGWVGWLLGGLVGVGCWMVGWLQRVDLTSRRVGRCSLHCGIWAGEWAGRSRNHSKNHIKSEQERKDIGVFWVCVYLLPIVGFWFWFWF